MNLDAEFCYKTNFAARKRLSAWVSEFDQYQTFAEGCSLLFDYYDANNVLERDYWTLHEMLMRWNSCITIALYYGNPYQIENFVPFAQKQSNVISEEMVRRMSKRIHKTVFPVQKSHQLDAKQIKKDINVMRVFEHYFPEIQRQRSKIKKAHCPSGTHEDKNPSMAIYPIGKMHCFTCNLQEDVFGMIMLMDNCDFATAVARANELGR